MLLSAVSCIERAELAIKKSDNISFVAYLQKNRTPGVKSMSSNLVSESENWKVELSTKAALTSKLEGYAQVLGYTYNESIASDQAPWDILSGVKYSFNGDELTSSASVRWGQIKTDTIKI